MQTVNKRILSISIFITILSFALIINGCNKEGGLEFSEPTVDKPGGQVGTGETASLSIQVKNPKGKKVEYEWQTDKGTIARSQLSPTIATYTAPNTPGDDIVILKVKSNGKEIFASKPVKITVVSTVATTMNPETDNGSAISLTANSPLQGNITITSPANGSMLKDQEVTVKGKYSNLAKNLYIWVLTYSYDARRYYPQSDRPDSAPLTISGTSGDWEETAYIGPDGKVTKGQSFDIMVVLANDKASGFFNQTLQTWSAQKNFLGLKASQLPNGITEKGRIKVTRIP